MLKDLVNVRSRRDIFRQANSKSHAPGRRPLHAIPARPKAAPKELLPVVDRPLIQYAVYEAREAGIEKMIFVTGRGQGCHQGLFRHRL